MSGRNEPMPEEELEEHAWFWDNAFDKTHPIGRLEPNDWGLHDFRHADRGSMLRVKGQDGFCPLGPALVDAAEVDPTAGEVDPLPLEAEQLVAPEAGGLESGRTVMGRLAGPEQIQIGAMEYEHVGHAGRSVRCNGRSKCAPTPSICPNPAGYRRVSGR
jgi:hypothetical protein